jgi:hypothetical protein
MFLRSQSQIYKDNISPRVALFSAVHFFIGMNSCNCRRINAAAETWKARARPVAFVADLLTGVIGSLNLFMRWAIVGWNICVPWQATDRASCATGRRLRPARAPSCAEPGGRISACATVQ